MKVAAAAYPAEFLDSWQAYETKLTRWVSEAAGAGADLLVFPEYGAMELATLAGREVALDLEASLHAVSERVPAADDLHASLARRFGVHILAASAPVFDPAIGPRPVNRARFFAPSGEMGVQDKQIMTRFERLLADGVLNQPGWTYAEIDRDAVARVRREGVVLNRQHWDDQAGRDGAPEVTTLR